MISEVIGKNSISDIFILFDEKIIEDVSNNNISKSLVDFYE